MKKYVWLLPALIGGGLCVFLKAYVFPVVGMDPPAAHQAGFFVCAVALPVLLQQVSRAAGRRWKGWYRSGASCLIWVTFWALMTALFLFWLTPAAGMRPAIMGVLTFTTFQGVALLIALIVACAAVDRVLGRRESGG